MLAEFLEALAKRVEAAQQTRVLINQLSPGQKDCWLLQPNRLAEPIEYEWRESHTVATINDLVELVNDYGKDLATVWHSDQFVVGLLDGTRRGGRVVYHLEQTTPFSLLSKWAEESPVCDHRSFLRTLRHELRGCNLDFLRDTIRRVEFTSGSKVVSEKNLRVDTLGRSVDHAVVTSGGELPEEVTAIVPLWVGLPYAEPVICTVETDLQNGRFGLWPQPGELERAQLAGHASLRGLLTSELDAASVYAGQPDFV